MPGFGIFRRDCVRFDNFAFRDDEIAFRFLVPVASQTWHVGTLLKRSHAVKLSLTIFTLRLVQLKKSATAAFMKALNPWRAILCSVGWTSKIEQSILSLEKSSSEYLG